MPDIGGAQRSGGSASTGLGAMLVAGTDIDAIQRGFVAQTYPSLMGAGAIGAPNNGRIELSRWFHPGGPITNVYFGYGGTPLVNGTAGQNFVGIYDMAGNRVAQSADATALFAAAPANNLWIIPLAGGPITLAAGFYRLALLENQSGGANTNLVRLSLSTGVMQLGNPAASGIICQTADTGVTALPAVLGAQSLGSSYYWAAFA